MLLAVGCQDPISLSTYPLVPAGSASASPMGMMAPTAIRGDVPLDVPGCAETSDCRQHPHMSPCEEWVCHGGQCVMATILGGSVCDDGDPCTFADVCVAGRCEGIPGRCEPTMAHERVSGVPLQGVKTTL